MNLWTCKENIFSLQLNIPYKEVLCKNTYVGRTFIQPTMRLRQLGVAKKFGPLFENFEGKRIVLIDDSIVRGNTMGSIVRLLKRFGAKEVYCVSTECDANTCACTNACWHACLHTHTLLHTCMHTHRHIRTCTRTHTHAQALTHAHTLKHAFSLSPSLSLFFSCFSLSVTQWWNVNSWK